MRTDPPAGESLAEDGTLQYWVSLGPEPVTIPTDLAGKSQALLVLGEAPRDVAAREVEIAA